MKTGLVIFGLLCTTSCGASADPERDRIEAERAVANAKLADAQRECAVRFIVAACVDEARTAHREISRRLRRRELQLDDAARRAAAEGRLKSIADKAQSPQPRANEAAPDVLKVRMRRAAPAASNAEDRETEDSAPNLPSRAASSESRGAVEDVQQQKFEARQREATARRAAATQRNALRAASGKVAAPLPLPSAAR